jgi:hypothetical protein
MPPQWRNGQRDPQWRHVFDVPGPRPQGAPKSVYADCRCEGLLATGIRLGKVVGRQLPNGTLARDAEIQQFPSGA